MRSKLQWISKIVPLPLFMIERLLAPIEFGDVFCFALILLLPMRTVDVGDFTIGDGHPPRVMGVLNMSIESNWEPNVRASPDNAALLAEELIEQGADIIDIGLQSANPKNEWLPPEVELDRLSAALEVIDRVDSDAAVFSIETRYAQVAEEALVGGFDLVNDVCGFADPDMPEICETHDVPVIKMASPPDVKKPGHVKTIDDVFTALQQGGFTEKTIIDPAFGGWYEEKTFEDNWEMFRRLREFRAFGRPILTATNREDFLGAIAGKMENEDQLYVSLAAAALEIDRGVDIIRTHDVPETNDVVKVAHHLQTERLVADSPRIVELREISRRELERFEMVSGAEPDSLADSALYCFYIDVFDTRIESEILEAANESKTAIIKDEDCLVLAGTHNGFRNFIDQLDTSSTAIAEVVGGIRRALLR